MSQAWFEVFGYDKTTTKGNTTLVQSGHFALSFCPTKSKESSTPKCFARIPLSAEQAALGLAALIERYKAGQLVAQARPNADARNPRIHPESSSAVLAKFHSHSLPPPPPGTKVLRVINGQTEWVSSCRV